MTDEHLDPEAREQLEIIREAAADAREGNISLREVTTALADQLRKLNP